MSVRKNLIEAIRTRMQGSDELAALDNAAREKATLLRSSDAILETAMTRLADAILGSGIPEGEALGVLRDMPDNKFEDALYDGMDKKLELKVPAKPDAAATQPERKHLRA